MATIVLGTLGSFIGGPIGGAVGGAIGGLIDNRFIYPSLFPQPDVFGPRLDSLKVQTQEEGTPIIRYFGPNPRGAGAVIWSSDIYEEEQADQEGGKGGSGGQTVISYLYYVDLAVAVGGPILGLKEIRGDGKVIWIKDPHVVSVAGTVISVNRVNGLNTDIFSTDPSVDLSLFQSGYEVVITGFSNGANNGTFYVVNSQKTGGGHSHLRIRNSSGVVEAAGASVSLVQTLPNASPDMVDEVTIYDGSGLQDPSPLIESREGPGNVPAFRGVSYVTFERLALRHFGNRIPQFSFVIEAQASATPASVIASVLDSAGFQETQYDLSRVSATPIRGYAITGPTEPVKALQPLMLAYDILEQERDDVLHFFDRLKAITIDVRAVDLSAHEGEGGPPRLVDVSPIEEHAIPSEVSTRYLDEEADVQNGSQVARRSTFRNDNHVILDIPIVLFGSEGKIISKRMLWTAAANKEEISGFLPLRYAEICENDVLRFAAYGDVWDVLLRQVDVGANFLIAWIGVVEIREVRKQTAEADPPLGIVEAGLYLPPHVEGLVIDAPPVTTAQVQSPGLIAAGAIPDDAPFWAGASLWLSTDGSDFIHAAAFERQSTLGGALTVLGAGPVGYFDLVNTVEIEILHGTLSSVTEEALLNGANRAILGGEVIGFQNATLIGSKIYRLSKLLRGLRNTEAAVGTHTSTDRFLALNPKGPIFYQMNLASRGVNRYFRIGASGRSPDDIVDTVTLQPTFRSITPFGPVHLSAARDLPSSGDVTLNWLRRTRSIVRLLSPDPIPVDENLEKYQVDVIYPAGSATVVRTITVTGAQSTVYTAAMQTDDGLSAGAEFEFSVYQMSDRVGRGNASDTHLVEAT